MLRADALSKHYRSAAGSVIALDQFSYTFQPHKVSAIMGPSGSGKSTLLNLLAGLDSATFGNVWLNDTNITALPEYKCAELRLKNFGFVFQSFNLVTVLTALQNVAFPMGLAGLSASERKTRATELLSQFGLAERLHHLPHKLSGGERQRVALARALANNPDVVFADEPTGNLDSKSGQAVLRALQAVAAEGRTVIVVTHDPRVAGIADEVVELLDGRRVTSREAA